MIPVSIVLITIHCSNEPVEANILQRLKANKPLFREHHKGTVQGDVVGVQGVRRDVGEFGERQSSAEMMFAC